MMGFMTWVKDYLGDAFEARTLPLSQEAGDGHDELVATLVRRRLPGSHKAILYVHGYNDYFFQSHLADYFIGLGYSFYALDLRRCGRSLRPGQVPSMVGSLSEYFTELNEATRIVREEDGHEVMVINAHSTGALTTCLWAHRNRGTGIIDAMVLNSPFFEINASWMARRVAPVALAPVARRWPLRVLPSGISGVYGQSIHADHRGNWQFDTAWKPIEGIPTRMGWVLAITHAQRRLRRGLNIDVPVLVAASTASYKRPGWSDDALRMDTVLDVEHMTRWASVLGQDTTLIQIPGGMHDLALSADPARQFYFDALEQWLKEHVQ